MSEKAVKRNTGRAHTVQESLKPNGYEVCPVESDCASCHAFVRKTKECVKRKALDSVAQGVTSDMYVAVGTSYMERMSGSLINWLATITRSG